MSDSVFTAAAVSSPHRLLRCHHRVGPTIYSQNPSSHLVFCPSSSSKRATISASSSSPSPLTPVSSSSSSAQRSGFEDDDALMSIELGQISSEEQLDRVLAEAQQLDEPLILLWTASWCRKCIYLKPKLEKLAAEYYPRIRFYSVDVNEVPQKLVNRAGVIKMPTIQLWRNSKKRDEVIGGDKTWLVIDDVRKMIEDDDDAI